MKSAVHCLYMSVDAAAACRTRLAGLHTDVCSSAKSDPLCSDRGDVRTDRSNKQSLKPGSRNQCHHVQHVMLIANHHQHLESI